MASAKMKVDVQMAGDPYRDAPTLDGRSKARQ